MRLSFGTIDLFQAIGPELRLVEFLSQARTIADNALARANSAQASADAAMAAATDAGAASSRSETSKARSDNGMGTSLYFQGPIRARWAGARAPDLAPCPAQLYWRHVPDEIPVRLARRLLGVSSGLTHRLEPPCTY